MTTKIDPQYEYDAKVMRVVDGDTVDVEIDLGFDLTIQQRVRVFGINCPEIHSTDRDEKTRGESAAAFTRQFLPEGSPVVLRTHKAGNEKFGRFLAEIHTQGGRDLGKALIAAGHALVWDGQGAKPI
jgi:micrococcal nuclease